MDAMNTETSPGNERVRGYTINPAAVGHRYTMVHLDGTEERRLVVHVERSTIFGEDDEGWIEESEVVQDA